MTYPRSRLICCAISFLLTAPALALAQQSAASVAPMSSMTGPADQAFSSSMDQMQKTMSAAPMTGNADRDFVSMMLPHHQGAVAMAKVELRYGKDPMLRKMARDIIASQDKEIAEMHAWQAAHPK